MEILWYFWKIIALKEQISFKNRVHQGHHKVVSPNLLEQFDFPMVTGILSDEMHLCFLGGCNKLK